MRTMKTKIPGSERKNFGENPSNIAVHGTFLKNTFRIICKTFPRNSIIFLPFCPKFEDLSHENLLRNGTNYPRLIVSVSVIPFLSRLKRQSRKEKKK